MKWGIIFFGGGGIGYWSKYTPLHEKGIKKTKIKPMETTLRL